MIVFDNSVSPKESIQLEIDIVLSNVLDGALEALEARKYAVMLAKIAEGILADKEVLRIAIDETQRLGKDNTLNGVRYSIMEAAPKYDYSKSDAYKFQSANVKREAEKLKEVESVAKNITEAATIEIYGNTLEVLPAIKSSITTVKIELL